ncbi:MAG: hypothetical protein M2R45_00653 [Verrucomicrobia subdivision 3 bacterium]|nr:hypothetical protein [Limisphaerales bacterium]MCS1414464.1 hypothetical protein [Limisphaerales bacterium]
MDKQEIGKYLLLNEWFCFRQPGQVVQRHAGRIGGDGN